jgi:uncharacterized membrane protein
MHRWTDNDEDRDDYAARCFSLAFWLSLCALLTALALGVVK